jgi:dTDP-4-amino-4,6-dideoxygalactose transaminase
MEVPLLDLKAQYATIHDKIKTAVDAVLDSQAFILGAQVAGLEEEIAKVCGVPYAVAVASGTDALLLSLKALGIGPGDSVVTVPFTFFATAGAIVNLGARPLFVDIEEDTFNMDPDRLSSFLGRECTFNLSTQKLVHKTSNTVVKAIVPVHLFGQCVDMDEILPLGRSYQLPIVEDACQAIGSKYHDECAGSMGDLGCFSFFPTKNLGGAGDGGMVVTRNKDLAALVKLLRGHGARQKYHHSIVGFNSRLDEIQAAILRVKLGFLEGWSQARRRNAEAYERDFRSAGLLGRILPPPTLADRSHIFHQYVIRCQNRDELRAFLKARSIGSEVYYPVPLHEQECFRRLAYSPSDFPRSRAAAQQTLALPIYPELREEQRKFVVSAIAEFYHQNPQA